MPNYAVILAAGVGARMKFSPDALTSKCIYPILFKPMIYYILDLINDVSKILNTSITPISVIKHKKELYESLIKQNSLFAYQNEKYHGNGAAFISSLDLIKPQGYTLVIPGDKPLIKPNTIVKLINKHLKDGNDITFIETIVGYRSNYGRCEKKDGRIIEIKEKNFKGFDRSNKYANTSIYCINNRIISFFKNSFTSINNELFLSEIIKISRQKGYKIGSINIKTPLEFKGVNNFNDLTYVSNIIRRNINKTHMKNGVNIINPDTVTIGSNISIGEGTIIYPNTVLSGNTTIGKNCLIGPNSEIHNSIIQDNNEIKHSIVNDSKIGCNNKIGPFSHLRGENIINNNIKIGNFVEIKKSSIDDNTKISHLTYVGDSIVGKRVNFGCGVITVNYDGKNKYITKIGDNVFIGCNCNLIAPITLENNSYIAAGSTITTNVPKNALSIARTHQINKENYSLKYPYYKK